MAKVLPISGGVSAELFGFALGKAQAMEKGFIGFSKEIRNDVGLVQFRKDFQGKVTAFVQNAPVFAAVISGVRVPTVVDFKASMPFPVNSKPKINNGTFPATSLVPVVPYSEYRRGGISQFGSSPYSNIYIRRGQFEATDINDLETSIIYKVYTPAGLVETQNNILKYRRDRLGETFERHQESYNVPVICAGNRAVLASQESDTHFERNLVIDQEHSSGMGDEGAVWYDTTVTATETGFSWIRLRVLSGEGDKSKYRIIDVAKQPYSKTTVHIVKPNGFITIFSKRTIVSLNSLQPSLGTRSFVNAESVQVSPNGSIFVLRETNQTSHMREYVDNTITHTLEVSAARSMFLTFVAPDDSVYERIYSRDLGEHGFFTSVIPSADNKKAYVYYALHDSSEPKPSGVGYGSYGEPNDFLPFEYKEYLDVIDIKTNKVDGKTTYSFNKSKTIDLGHITRRTINVYRQFVIKVPGVWYYRTDTYASKLFGATLEVGGFIWSNRFCYSLAENKFYSFEPVAFFYIGPNISPGQIIRNVVTGNSGYIFKYHAISTDGRSAAFYSLARRLAGNYRLKVDDQNNTTVEKLQESEIQGRFSFNYNEESDDNGNEELSALNMVFPKPSI